MLNIEARILIGWYSLASQSERVPTCCFYVKVAYLSYGEYSTKNFKINHCHLNCKRFVKILLFMCLLISRSNIPEHDKARKERLKAIKEAMKAKKLADENAVKETNENFLIL